jgi:hypothetical protein
MNDPLSPKRETLAAGEAEVARLESQISTTKQRITLLSQEADDLRREAREAYRAKFEKKYATFDVARALAGLNVSHAIVALGQHYVIQLPSQAVVTNVDKSLSEAKELGPFSASERILLAWLVGVGVENHIQSLPAEPKDKLGLIRKIPAVLLDKIADEAISLESYVQVVLEQELKN